MLGAAGLLTVLAGFFAAKLPVLTSRDDMVRRDLPVQQRYVEFNQEFGTQNQLVIVLSGDPDATRRAADVVAASLAGDPTWVRNVFYRLDLAPFRRAGLYFLSEDALKRLRDQLAALGPRIGGALAAGSWEKLLAAAQEEAGKLAADSVADAGRVERGIDLADRLLGEWQRFLEQPDAAHPLDLEALFADPSLLAGGEGIDADGYLTGRDGATRVLFVQQSQNTDRVEFTLPFMAYCRKTVADVLARHPGVTAGFTGWPVSIEEERGLIERDLGRITAIAIVVILLFFYFTFRSLHRTVLVFIPLVCGVVWNFGLTRFTIGHLNYLTSAFVGILFGMGMDFGILFVRRFDEERAAGREVSEAVRNMLLAVGPSVVSGGGAVIVSFFAIGITDQPAFSELGILAGSGILCVVVSTLLVLTTLLARFPPRTRHYGTTKGAESRWLKPVAARVLRFPVPLTVLGVVGFGVLAAQVTKVGFDYNLNNLLPLDSETLRVGRLLEENTRYKTQYVTVILDNLEQERRLVPLLRALPTVAQVDAISVMLPERQEGKRALFAPIARELERWRVGAPAAPDLPVLRARVAALRALVERGQEDAFATGRGNLVAPLDRLIRRLAAIEQALAAPGSVAGEAAFERELFRAIDRTRAEILTLLAAPPITPESLDPRLVERFIGKNGRPAVFIFPKEEIWDLDFLGRFLAETESVVAQVVGEEQASERLTGFGVVYNTTARMIRRGFSQASWTAGAVVLLVLVVTFRRTRDVLLALVPLVCAAVGAMGGLGLLGKDLNLASQISFPILLGAGVDYGIFMVRRWLEPDGADLPHVVGTMGSSIGLGAATAMTGFGSLMLAHHRGLISFGAILFAAIFVAMLAAQFGIPLLIKTLRLDRRVQS